MNIQRKNSAHHFRMQSEREQTCRVARIETRGIFLSNSCSLCHRNQLEHVMPITSHGNLFKSGAPHIHILSQFTTILLVVRSANTVTSKASCKVNLLKTILTHEFVHQNVSSFGQIEQGVHYIGKSLDLLDNESVSGARNGRVSL